MGRVCGYRSTAAAGVVVVMLGLSACGTDPTEGTPSHAALGFTRGPVPESAHRADGSIDLSRVPDFIPAAGEHGDVGWIWSADVLPPPGEEHPTVITVYGDDLVTVVGHMHPGVGFVPLGAEAEMLPDPQRNRELVIRVQNESARPAVLEVTEARDEVDRLPRLIAPPIVLEAGADEDVVFRAPRDRWSLNLRGDEGFFFSDDLGVRASKPEFALTVTEDGVLEIADDG